jgi:hypothetical protein
MNKDDELYKQMRRQCRTPQDFTVLVLFATRDLYDRLVADDSKSGQIVMQAIMDWGKSCKAGLNESPPIIPTCSCCDRTLRQGEVGGWVVLVPLSDDPNAVGSTGAICEQCARVDRDALRAKLLQSIRDEFDADVEIQTMQ